MNPANISCVPQQLPTFLWLLRDVTLDMPDREDGASMTPTEYLREVVLNEKQACKAHDLLKLFPTLKGATLPTPCVNPQRNPTDERNMHFKQEIEKLLGEILPSIKPKKGFSGTKLDGSLLASLITKYKDAINASDAIPDIENCWYTVIFIHLLKSVDKLVQQYRQEMSKYICKYPMEVGFLEESECNNTLCGCHNIALKGCLRFLDDDIKKLVLPGGSNDLENTRFQKQRENLHTKLKEKIGHFNESMDKCTGELAYFFQENFNKSFEECKICFQGLYMRAVDDINRKELEEKYLSKTLSKGPAQKQVLNDELQCISGPPVYLHVYKDPKNCRCLSLQWSMPTILPNATKDYEIQLKELSGEWKLVTYSYTEKKHNLYRAMVCSLSPNTEYRFRIRGRGDNRVGEYCDPVPCKTPAGIPDPPLPPGFKQESHCEATISVHPLNDGQDNGSSVNVVMLQYRFVNKYKANNEQIWDDEEIELKDDYHFPLCHKIQLASYDVEGYYHFRVKFKNKVGYSEPSPPCIVETQDLIPDKPANIEIESHVRSLVFKWQPPKFHPKSVKRYEVKYRKKGCAEWKGSQIIEDCRFTVDSLQACTEYEYEIVALNYHFEGGKVKHFAWTNATVPGQPNPPNLRVINSRKVHVTLQKLNKEQENGKEVINMKVEKSVDKQTWIPYETGNEEEIEVDLCSTDGNEVITYIYFHALMQNEIGWSQPSREAVIQCSDLIPSDPKSLVVESGPTHATLKWEKPGFHPQIVKHYSIILQKHDNHEQIYRCYKHHFSISNLCPDTWYSVKVQSQNENGLGEFSRKQEFRTPFAPPRAPSRGQVNIEVMTEKQAKWEVNIPRAQQGEKKVVYIIVEKCTDQNGPWEKDLEERVTCPEGGMMEFRSNYKKYMRLRFKNDVGISEPSDIVTVPNAQMIPGVPISLEVMEKTPTSVTLCWDKPQANKESAKKYRIEKKIDNYWTKVESVTGHNFTIKGVEPCQVIGFRICAKNDKKRGDYCEPIEVTTCPTTPGTPAVKMVTYNSARVSIIRADVQNVEKICIETQKINEVEWSSTEIPSENFKDNDPKHPNPACVSYTHEFEGTPLNWRIKKICRNLESDYCEPRHLESTEYITLPPTGVGIAEYTETSLKVVWDKPDNLSERIDKYVIIIQNIQDGSQKQYQVNKDTYHFWCVHLNVATHYRVEVCASNECSELDQKMSVEGKTRWTDARQPTHLRKAGATHSSIKIRWHPPKNDSSVNEYNVYYKKSEVLDYTFFKRLFHTSTVVDELESATSYDFKVVSVNKDGKEGGSIECTEVRTKRSKQNRNALVGALAVPTVGIGSVIAHYEWRSDSDVNDSS